MKFKLISQFPDFNTPGFDIGKHNGQFHDSNIVILARGREVFYAEHWSGLSIKSAFAGAEHYSGNNFHYRVRPGTYLVFNRDSYYRSFSDDGGELESFTINFTPAFESMALQAINARHEHLLDGIESDSRLHVTPKLQSYNGGRLGENIRRLRSLIDQPQLQPTDIEGIYFQMFEDIVAGELDTRADMQQINATRVSTRSELYVRLTRAKDYIDSCFDRPISLADVANVACLNRYYFLRQFKKLYGLTPMQYLQQCRLAEARSLLLAGDRSVSDVCTEVGFQDAASFTKLFKSFYKVLPSEL